MRWTFPRPRLLSVSLACPALNLAMDEALLQVAEKTPGARPILRLWESPRPFIVLGVGQKIAQEVDTAACEEADVPILRRCSAGGCVMQGPGCLNFALVVTFDCHEAMRSVRESYGLLLAPVIAALASLGVTAHLAGTSDLALEDGVKISGNAQKRRQRFFLHHGTLLCALDLSLLPHLIREPIDRPGYRGPRAHNDFVRNLDVDTRIMAGALIAAFDAESAGSPTHEEMALARSLAQEKYLDPAWTSRR